VHPKVVEKLVAKQDVGVEEPLVYPDHSSQSQQEVEVDDCVELLAYQKVQQMKSA